MSITGMENPIIDRVSVHFWIPVIVRQIWCWNPSMPRLPRNNVTVSLVDALAAIYPAIQRITGVDSFRAMARFHVRTTPPTSPLLFEYGRDFPAFIEQYECARS